MADTSTTSTTPTPPAVAPGTASSEFKVTVVATVLSVMATVTGVVLDLLQSAQDAGVNGKWLSIALAIFGVIGTVLTAIGYQITRSHVKASALAASKAAPIIVASDAAANLGRVS